MKIRPELSEVLKAAGEGGYKTIPVSCEILSDFITPIEAVRVLKKASRHCYMLESAKADETWGRYTFLGYDPQAAITCEGGRLIITERGVTTERMTDSPS